MSTSAATAARKRSSSRSTPTPASSASARPIRRRWSPRRSSRRRCRTRSAAAWPSASLGQDPFEIDRLIHRMYEGSIFFGRQGAVIQAMSGVEIALWDIVGKATGRPVYQLLGGGFRKTFRAYASILFGDTPGGDGDDRPRAGRAGLSGGQVRLGADGPERGERHRPRPRGPAGAGPGRRADGGCRPVLGHGHRDPAGAAVRAVQPDLAGGAAAPGQPRRVTPACATAAADAHRRRRGDLRHQGVPADDGRRRHRRGAGGRDARRRPGALEAHRLGLRRAASAVRQSLATRPASTSPPACTSSPPCRTRTTSSIASSRGICAST